MVVWMCGVMTSLGSDAVDCLAEALLGVLASDF